MTWLNDATVTTADDKAAQAKESARLAAKAKLDATLADMEYTFPDGRVIQTRPRDQQWIMGGIELGGDEWVLADNTKALVTADELQEALTAAKLKVKAAFDIYKGALV